MQKKISHEKKIEKKKLENQTKIEGSEYSLAGCGGTGFEEYQLKLKITLTYKRLELCHVSSLSSYLLNITPLLEHIRSQKKKKKKAWKLDKV